VLRMADQTNDICVLHVGKAGGNYLRSILRHNKQHWTNPLHLMGPRTNLVRTAKKFGTDRKLAFIIRDPASRFVAAFNTRAAQDRPYDEKPWTPEEAIAFRWFETAEDLAKALCSDKPVELSAAKFAMLHIGHMDETYTSCFGTAANLIEEIPNIAVCIDLPHLDDKLPSVMKRLGLNHFEMPEEPKRNQASEVAEALSMEARAGLRCHWHEEFRLYNTARRISDALFR
jgi:hypothetical protein